MARAKRSVGDLRRNGPLGTLRSTVKKAKISLRNLPLNSGGYTRDGTYYGHGPKVYEAYNDVTGEYLVFRAFDRVAAKTKLNIALRDIDENPLAVSHDFNSYELKQFKHGSPEPEPGMIGSKEWHAEQERFEKRLAERLANENR